MSPLAQAVSGALIHFVWQGAIAGVLLWVALAALRRRSANLRYVASCAALAVLASLPVITTIVLYQGALPGDARAVLSAAPLLAHESTLQTVGAWSGADHQPLAWLVGLQVWALPTWSLGVLLCSARLVYGGTQAVVLGRRGECADDSILETVAALAARMGIERPVRVLMSNGVDGPSVLGWLRPVILLPPATAMGLTPQQLEAVLAHELAHILRHDYVVNILQMVAETLYFYHPAIWWASKQIRLERELCCDDLAVETCGDALTYARALTILERLRVTMPSLVMGAAGGSLRYRIQRVLGAGHRDSVFSRWAGVLALSLGVASIALNAGFVRAQTQAAPDRLVFETASVKAHDPGDRLRVNHPNLANGRLTMRNVPLGTVIRQAYGPSFPLPLPQERMAGGPDWMERDRFTVEASAGRSVRPEEMASMLRSLLEERFKLVARVETRQLPVYFLRLVSRDGALGKALHRSKIDCEKAPRCGIGGGPGKFMLGASPMALLATSLTELVNRPVLDLTGLTGTFDGNLDWTPEPEEFAHFGGPSADRPAPSGPSLFTALREQFGLKLESGRGPIEFLVIERAEKPTDD